MVAMLGDGSADHFPEPGPGPRLATWAPVAGGEGPGNVESSGGVTVAFAGYLHGLPAGLQSEAEYVLARYHAGDWSWLASAAGVFSFAVVDRRRHRCVLGVDRLGVRPLLWMQDAAGVAFASDLAAFVPRLGPDREVDHDVLQEMLAVGFPLSDRTLLAGVERVPPGTLIEFEHGKTRATRYWSVADLPPIRSQDPDAFLDESQERLRYALRGLLSRSSGRALCPLSSGYDSRRLLLEGHAGGAALSTVTGVEFEPRGGRLVSLEPAVAGELCRRLGFANRQVLTPGYSPMSPATARFVRNSFLDFQVIDHAHCWAMPMVGAVAQWRGQAALDGLHGDTFFNNPYYHLPRSVWGRWSAGTDVLDGIVANRDRWDRAWNGLVSRSLTARLTDAIRALPEGPYRLSYLFMLGRSSRITSLLPYGLLDLHVHPLCPYLDPIVMEHAMTFDPVLKGDLRLQARALGRHFPAFSDGIHQARKPVDSLSGDAKLGGRVRGEREGGRDHRLHTVNLTARQIRVSIRASSSPGAPRDRCLAHRSKSTPFLVAIPNGWKGVRRTSWTPPRTVPRTPHKPRPWSSPARSCTNRSGPCPCSASPSGTGSPMLRSPRPAGSSCA